MKRPNAFFKLARAAAILLAGVIAFLLTIAMLPTSGPIPEWTDAQGKAPRDFLVLMFPKASDVPLRFSPGGDAAGGLSRAVVNTLGEIEGGGWVQVLSGDGTHWVRIDELAFVAEPERLSVLTNACVTNYTERTRGAMGSMNVSRQALPTGATRVRLNLSPDDDHVNVFVYDVLAGGSAIEPREMYRYFGPGEALQWLERAALGVTGALVAMCAAWGAMRIWARRARAA